SRLFRRKILILPEQQQQVINHYIDAYKDKLPSIDAPDIGSRCHALIDAVHMAFSQHFPLALSPDDIWLVIAQGFSHHVAENAETLRHRLVRHQGRRELSTECYDLSQPSFEHAIEGFSSQLQQAIDPVLHETLICDFSSTTPASRIA